MPFLNSNLFWKLLVAEKIYIYIYNIHINLFKMCKSRSCVTVKEKVEFE